MATAENTAAVSFPTPTGAWADPTHFTLNTASSGTTGRLATRPLSADVDAPEDGAVVQFAAGELTIVLTGGQLTEAAWAFALAGLIDRTIYVGLHSAEPLDGDSDDHELSGNGYARASIASGGWTTS